MVGTSTDATEMLAVGLIVISFYSFFSSLAAFMIFSLSLIFCGFTLVSLECGFSFISPIWGFLLPSVVENSQPLKFSSPTFSLFFLSGLRSGLCETHVSSMLSTARSYFLSPSLHVAF